MEDLILRGFYKGDNKYKRFVLIKPEHKFIGRCIKIVSYALKYKGEIKSKKYYYYVYRFLFIPVWYKSVTEKEFYNFPYKNLDLIK